MTALFALASAVLVGGGDFIGGLVARRAPAAAVAFVAQCVGLVLGVPLALVWGWESVSTRDVVLSLISGAFVGVGLALFYGAMAAGKISLVAPTTAVTGAVVPICVGLAGGDRPGASALLGIPIALVAVAVVSLARDGARSEGSRTRSVLLSLAAGACFGLFYVSLAAVSEESGVWPVSIQRIASVSLLGIVLLATRTPVRSLGGLARPGVAIAVLEVAATALLLLALQRGPLAIASVLASLYPVTTVLLAAVYLRERLSRVQLGGIALALTAVVLIALG